MTEQDSDQLPEVGHHRCYWALLSDRLEFIYFDPVLQYHLQGQAGSLYGQFLLSFVHPDERETAEHDLGSVLREHSLHGSITRVRFFRLSKVRQKLGFSGPSAPLFPSAERVVLDEQFMAVDITINWVAEGLVLCFIHASFDIDTVADNNHVVKSPWTNWCGTPVMSAEHTALLFGRLLCAVPQISHRRKFQILSNKPGRPLLISWPPGAPEEDMNCRALVDKMDFEQGPRGESSSDCSNPEAKTNCSRRFLSRGEVEAGIESESVFIPHGCVIFACHKLSPFPSSPPSADRKASPGSSSSTNTTSTSAISLASMGYNNSSAPSYPLPSPHQSTQSTFYDHHHYSLPPLQSTTLPSSPTSYSYQPSQHHHSSLTSPYSNYSGSAWTQPTHPSVQSLRSSYWGHGSGYDNGQGGPPQLSLNSGPPQPHNYKPLSPAGYSSYSPTTPSSAGAGTNEDHPSPTSASSNSVDVVPPPRRRVSPSSREYGGNGSGKEGKSHGNRPVGVSRCSSCKATTSPEWRKGPSGKKELCNACGLRYARSRAKKEGHVPSSARRRKDKILKPRESTTPPVALYAAPGSALSTYSHSSPVGPYQPSSTPPYGSGSSSLRRVYPNHSSYDDSFSSGSGSDVYTHRSSLGTPSPSPPAGGTTGSFAHYQSGHHSDHTVHSSAARVYYASSIPSPLASVPPTTMSSQSFDNEREDAAVVKRETLSTPASVERQYYEASVSREPRSAEFSRYDILERRDARDYERDFKRENKGRGLVTG